MVNFMDDNRVLARNMKQWRMQQRQNNCVVT